MSSYVKPLPSFEEAVQPAVETLSNAPGLGETVDAAANVVNTLTQKMEEVFGETLDRLGVDRSAFDAVGDASKTALVDFLKALKELKTLRDMVLAQHEVVRREVVAQPLSVAARGDKVLIVRQLMDRILRAGESLKAVLLALNAFIDTLPEEVQSEVRDQLRGLDQRFDTWLGNT